MFFRPRRRSIHPFRTRRSGGGTQRTRIISGKSTELDVTPKSLGPITAKTKKKRRTIREKKGHWKESGKEDSSAAGEGDLILPPA